MAGADKVGRPTDALIIVDVLPVERNIEHHM
jgi:hypothetical protein